VFDEDLKAVMKRFPSSLPKEYENNRFLKSLPIGTALIGDRSEESNRAFVIRIRPRFSQHEGREIGTIEPGEKMEAGKLAELVGKKLEDMGELSLIKVNEIVDTYTRRYGEKIDADEIIESVRKAKGAELTEDRLIIPGFEKRLERMEELEKGQKALAVRIDENQAKTRAEKMRHKKTLGLFGNEEKVKELKLVYELVYRVKYDLMLESGGYRPMSLYLDPDFELYYWDKSLKKTKDMKVVADTDEKRMRVLKELRRTDNAGKIADRTRMPLQTVTKSLRGLVDDGLVELKDSRYRLRRKLDVLGIEPQNLAIDDRLSFAKPDKYELEEYEIDKKKLLKIPSIFGNVKVRDFETVFKPVWKVTFESKTGLRVEKIDAL
jgi:DNA-binding transcriptional ArsR family regulator